MESVLSASDKQNMVSSFLEIAVGQSTETAIQFLQATSWRLEEAIQLFYVGNEGAAVASSSHSSPMENISSRPDESSGGLKKDAGNEFLGEDVEDEIRPPLPVIREALYDDTMLYGASRMGYPPHEPNALVAFRNFEEELKRPGIWESDQGAASTMDNSRDNLASLYRPPFALMHHGPFEKAKVAASVQDKWLLVNLQSTKEFSSHMLNRDTWANEAVAQTISSNFIFWQVYDDTSEGRKVCTYYKLDSIPVILVIDPITGQKMRSWCGMIQPDSLLEDLLPFMDGGPKDHHVSLSHKRPRESYHTSAHKTKVVADETNEEDAEVQLALAASMENMKNPSGINSKDKNAISATKEETHLSRKPSYPPLPEEPKGDRNLICRVGIRLPDGRRLQRNFFRTDPIQLLWSFCHSQLKEGGLRPFHLTHAIPGASKCLEYESNLTFEEAGVANSMISVTWE
ncbi:plant UBX domain-containing protein 7 isoform X2 [Malania oleifera]|uniref:plant UBX domain-containing protein 7 isoform X2 n=1 Tax=Malania oleifera TaxID=397392 RepID=UPI0025AE3565|nr:plant UBX domain-containing protein 7 isoform X2 [Malania oleifera]